jgi:hypothetical protein
MSVRIIPKSQQGYGAFNGGEIIENKPIGFPQDNSSVRPYSNLFYWAHAKGTTDSTIGLHPHQGFEICSFVLKGEIKHYDTKLKEWRPLKAGDVQIIRAGSGISHSEWLAKDSEIFQIWFDPNLNKTLEQPASYDDYKSAVFPRSEEHGVTVTTFVGAGSPFTMDTPGVEVKRFDLKNESYYFAADPEKIYSLYILDGNVSINGEKTEISDFVVVYSQSHVEMTASGSGVVFMVSSPVFPDYRTYAQMRGIGD